MTVTLVKDMVNVYDLNSNKFERWYDRSMAEELLAVARKQGDSLSEYDTTDRDGNPLRIVLQVENGLSEWNDYYSVNADGERFDAGGVWEFSGAQSYSAPAVSVHDIDWDLNWTPVGKPRTPWDQMSAEDADDQLMVSRQLGETVSEQEYSTQDRDGRPLRIVLLKQVPEAHQDADLGAVYEYML